MEPIYRLLHNYCKTYHYNSLLSGELYLIVHSGVRTIGGQWGLPIHKYIHSAMPAISVWLLFSAISSSLRLLQYTGIVNAHN